MLPADSPFTNETEIKELPHVLDGTFAWLWNTPTHKEWAIGDRTADELQPNLESAIASATERRISLPAEFVEFIQTPMLHKHLRSVTACYLDVADSVLPLENGYLLRFLNDQQGCAFWYLFLSADASDHCVVLSYEYFDAGEFEGIKETDFHIWSVSFEAFLSRFWLENEILFSEYDDTPPPDVDARFLDLYAQQ